MNEKIINSLLFFVYQTKKEEEEKDLRNSLLNELDDKIEPKHILYSSNEDLIKMKKEMGIKTGGAAPIKEQNFTPVKELEYLKQGMCKPNEKIVPGINACSKVEQWEKDEDFKKAMQFIKKAEGGYSDIKQDRGGKTNLGITQKAYDYYNDKRKLPRKSVKDLKENESMKIYYEDYWLPSGANKAQDKAIGLMLLDSSVNHGISGAKNLYKKSGDNFDKLIEARKNLYDERIKNLPDQKVFAKGWYNRLENIKKFKNENYQS